jgi:small conductance mechanosensitive channel
MNCYHNVRYGLLQGCFLAFWAGWATAGAAESGPKQVLEDASVAVAQDQNQAGEQPVDPQAQDGDAPDVVGQPTEEDQAAAPVPEPVTAPDDPRALALATLGTEGEELLTRIKEQTQSIKGFDDQVLQAGPQEVRALEDAAWSRRRERLATLDALVTNLLKQEELGNNTKDLQEKVINGVEERLNELLLSLEGLRRQHQSRLTGIKELTLEERLDAERELSGIESRATHAMRSIVALSYHLLRLGASTREDLDRSVEKLHERSKKVSVRLLAASETRQQHQAALSWAPDDAEAKIRLQISEEQFQRERYLLSECIALLSKLEQDTTDYQQAMVKATGEISAHLLSWKVIRGLFVDWWKSIVETIKTDGPSWMAKVFVFLSIMVSFKILAWSLRFFAGHLFAVKRAGFSVLLQQVLLGIMSRTIMIIGLFVALAQVGIPVGHLLAGLGIAGFIVGFALQDVLANFAAGAMILFTQPYDVDDFIDINGVMGRVSKMNIVSTTILTGDNQTYIVPNAKIWGDVIRNITANKVRRIDLVFNVDFNSDFHQVEEVCRAAVAQNETVLADPEPVVRIQGITQHSVQVIVRPWVAREDYWTTSSALTKAITQAFHEANIKIPRATMALPATG